MQREATGNKKSIPRNGCQGPGVLKVEKSMGRIKRILLGDLLRYNWTDWLVDLCIPRKGIAQPQSQFPHSCVCEQSTVFIPTIGPPIFLLQNRQTDHGNMVTSELGLWPRSSFSGNICFEFGIVSLQCPTQPGCDNGNIQIIGNAFPI